ncbi:MAG: hypothetical protein ACREQ5_34985, partial [Candidatus Dormibacteria bacterium]
SILFKDKLYPSGSLEQIPIINLREIPIITADNYCELNINYIKVYCDLIKEININGKKQKILRTQLIDLNKANDLLNYSFEHPIFIALRKNEFNSIKIRITDENDNNLCYEKGKFFITLIIQPIRIY